MSADAGMICEMNMLLTVLFRSIAGRQHAVRCVRSADTDRRIGLLRNGGMWGTRASQSVRVLAALYVSACMNAMKHAIESSQSSVLDGLLYIYADMLQ